MASCRVSFIIPSLGRFPLELVVRSCLRLCENRNAEILVVFDPRTPVSAVESLHRMAAKPLRVLFAEEPGVAAARNRGLQAAEGEVFILLDDDCLAGDSEWLERVEKQIEREPRALHGGVYQLQKRPSYWAEVYAWTNRSWLGIGVGPAGQQWHLLGGFLFGHRRLLPSMRFSPDLPWGGEEKELLLRLDREQGIPGRLHPEVSVVHWDVSGFGKFVQRAFWQGYAAGFAKLRSSFSLIELSISLRILPGSLIFYFFSRAGIVCGSLMRFRRANFKVPKTIPQPYDK